MMVVSSSQHKLVRLAGASSGARRWRTLTPLACALSVGLAACGGGGSDDAGGGPVEPAALAVQGTAAVGAGLAGAVSLKCANADGTGLVSGSITADAQGHYSTSLSGARLPCVAEITADGQPVLHGLATASTGSGGGVVLNLTPLTELLLTQVLGQVPQAWFAGVTATQLATITAAAQSGAWATVRAQLPAAVASGLGGVDPASVSFQPDGTGHDAALDALAAALRAGGTDLGGALTRLLAGQAVVPPYVNAASAAQGRAGDTLTLSGYALPATPVVMFGDTAASASTNAEGTQITVTVPAGLATGALSLSVTGVSGSVAFEVLAPVPEPTTLSGFSPVSGSAGTTVTVSGAHFGTEPTVTLGGVAVTLTSHSDTSLSFAVPAGVATGNQALVVNGVTAASSFQVSAAAASVAGATWTQVTAHAGASCSGQFYGVAHNGSRWVAVATERCIHVSDDGLNWRLASAAVNASSALKSVTWGNGRFVAVGARGAIVTSTDGETWSDVSYTPFDSSATEIRSVVWTGSRFIAVSNVSYTGTGSSCLNVLRSDDGLSWSASCTEPGAVAGSTVGNARILLGVAAHGSTVIAVGGADGRSAWRSADGGLTWSFIGQTSLSDTKFVIGSGGNPTNSVAWGNGRWVAVGAEGAWAMSSDDGLNWTSGDADTGAFTGLERVRFDGSQFIAVGPQQRIYTSTDGTQWTLRHVDTTVSAALTYGVLRDVAGVGTARLVAVGGLSSSTTGAAGFWTSVAP